MRTLQMASWAVLASLSLSACATSPLGSTKAQQVMQAARATCAAWPIADGAFKGLIGSGIVKLPPDAATWEAGISAVVTQTCSTIAKADAAGTPIDVTKLSDDLTLVANDIMAVTDYVASLKH